MNRDLTIYLAGFIQGAVIEECKAWRDKLVKTYENWNGKPYPIKWLDPLNGESEISKDGLTSNVPANLILHKDYQCCQKADLCVVNMNTFGQDRPLIGTQWELAWFYAQKKPIFMITENPMHHEYPFYKASVSWFFKDVEELIEKKAINLLYKAYHTPLKEINYGNH